jgi:hypothetical protein
MSSLSAKPNIFSIELDEEEPLADVHPLVYKRCPEDSSSRSSVRRNLSQIYSKTYIINGVELRPIRMCGIEKAD